MRLKLYQIKDYRGKMRYVICLEHINVEHHLEPDDTVETDCWLSDVLNCEIEDVTVVGFFDGVQR